MRALMPKMEILISSTLLVLVTVSCGTTYRVTHSGNPKKLDGVPFYKKSVACKHETIYLEPIYKLTLVNGPKVGDKGEVQPLGVVHISQSTYASQEFLNFLAQMAAHEPE